MKFNTKNIYDFIKQLKHFDYKVEYSDIVWQIIFPDIKKKWHRISITKYQDNYYISLVDGDLGTLEITPAEGVKIVPSGLSTHLNYNRDAIAIWNELITAAQNWLLVVKKDWIKANKLVQENYPLNRRFGFCPNSLIRALLHDIYRIDKDLGKAKVNKFINIVESGYFRDTEKTTRKSMTANDFFAYCKIAYIAAQSKKDNIDENLSGREMYERYADGRDEGLLAIDANSEKEFADWIDGKHPKKTTGGHPWEIKRGGNTTHIDLYVSRPSIYVKDEFKVILAGSAITRLKETICMFLDIYDAGLPISISDPEKIRKRLLAQDNVGIVPNYHSLHRANQLFREEQAVSDVLYFDDLGRQKTRIKPFITWKPLPVVKPRGIF